MDYMRSGNLEEDMAEDRYFWHLGVDGRFLAVEILTIKQLLLLPLLSS